MDALIVLVVTLLTLLTNLVYAVGVGLLISCARYSWLSSAGLRVTSTFEGGVKVYTVDGPLFFASAKAFQAAFNEKDDPDKVEVLFLQGELFDFTAISALSAVAKRYEAVGKRAIFCHLSTRSVKRVAKAAHLVAEVTIGTATSEAGPCRSQQPRQAGAWSGGGSPSTGQVSGQGLEGLAAADERLVELAAREEPAEEPGDDMSAVESSNASDLEDGETDRLAEESNASSLEATPTLKGRRRVRGGKQGKRFVRVQSFEALEISGEDAVVRGVKP